jgi:hypothetical protein
MISQTDWSAREERRRCWALNWKERVEDAAARIKVDERVMANILRQ